MNNNEPTYKYDCIYIRPYGSNEPYQEFHYEINGTNTLPEHDASGNDVDLEGGQNFVDFIDVTDDDYEIDFEQDITIYSSSNRHIKHVALVIDYYPEAIEYIYQTFLGDDTLDNTFEGILHFICDWTMEII